MAYPPDWLTEFKDDNTAVYDLDNESGREVIHVACEAIRIARISAVCIEIRDKTAPIDKLYPVFKSLLSRPGSVHWFYNDLHSGLSVFFNKAENINKYSIEDELHEMLTSVLS